MTLAPLPLEVRNPIKAHVAAARGDAHKRLARFAKTDVSALVGVRARNRLHKIRALLAFLNRTDAAASHTPTPPGPRLWTGEAVREHALEVAGVRAPDDGIPDRAERDRLLAPVLAELAKLAKRAPRRERKPTPTTKETLPMPSDPYHRPGQVVEEPAEETQRREQAAAAGQAAAPPGFPPRLWPEIHAFEGVFSVPNFEAVRRQRALDLARTMLDYPERDRVSLVASLFYRLAMRGGRDGRAL